MSDDREVVSTAWAQADSGLKPGFTFEELEAELRLELDAVLGFDKVVEDGKRIFTLPQLSVMYHCGRTAAQARALDAVGRGDMTRRT